ncbi:MAG: hypothetical protein D3922_02890 [Candidatus Electrothrix sp. AR1]|nr:hypothetical protein [Candidatus Electrothrix sp. AR1]
MSEKQDINIEAMAKLISLTRDGKLEWSSVSPGMVKGQQDDDIINSVFTTQYKDKFLRLYHRKYQNIPYSTAAVSGFFGAAVAASIKKKWYNEVVLELISEQGDSLWVFPKENILQDLLKAIKYKASGANDLIKSLLQE